jgi:flagellar protein FlgJ
MNVTDIGGLYYGDRSLSAIDSLKAAAASSAAVPAGARVSDPLSAVSPFARAMSAASAEVSTENSRRPLGAAANSGAKDAEHVSKKAAHIDRTDKLYDQCRELETFLIKNLLTSMRSTVEKSEMTDGGFAGKMYEDMLYDEYASSMSKNAGFGLADQAYLELSGQRGRT